MYLNGYEYHNLRHANASFHGITLEKLLGSEEIPSRKPGTGRWPVVSNGEACLCVLEVLPQDQAMLVCPFETAAVQPCDPVVCRRILKWRVGHSTPPFEGVYIDAVSLPVFLYSRINHTVFLYSQIDHTLAYTLQKSTVHRNHAAYHLPHRLCVPHGCERIGISSLQERRWRL
jgi:hypothetical protein